MISRIWKPLKAFVFILITDAYSKKILGFNIADNLEADNAVDALQMALKPMKENCSGLIHHSDRGVQYCSDKYVKALNKRNIGISMTENGDPLENAIAERVNGILKDEWLYELGKMDKSGMRKIIPQIIHIYNNEQPHLSLNMLTPNVAHQGGGELKRRWKNYYRSTREPQESNASSSHINTG
ncbi:MAG: DDE-type integrase/transposase/recombinase [Lewinellaceae bacterium]|nr:DDE-type integrase/transposase/recombinase [Lewinellaceae bacterium]